MDRFFVYLLIGLSAVLIVFATVAILPGRKPVEAVPIAQVEATPTPAPASTPLVGTPDPRELFMEADVELPVPDPVAVSMPKTYNPPNPGPVTTVVYPGFVVVYSEKLGSPLAVQYAMVNGAPPKRSPEPKKVKTPPERLIREAGYVPGPMALPESISLYFGKAAGRNTSLMPNTCAFSPECLNGPWAQFAEMEAKYAGEYGWLEIVAGPIFSSAPPKEGELLVPEAFYRCYRRPYGDTMAFIIPQMAVADNLKPYLSNIATVEAMTGMSIFANSISPEERMRTAEAVW